MCESLYKFKTHPQMFLIIQWHILGLEEKCHVKPPFLWWWLLSIHLTMDIIFRTKFFNWLKWKQDTKISQQSNAMWKPTPTASGGSLLWSSSFTAVLRPEGHVLGAEAPCHVHTVCRSHSALYSTHFDGSVGKCFWQIVISLFSPWMYFRWVSSFKTCATCFEKIFSLPVLAWIPTIVTPIGQGAFPIAIWR